MIRIEHDSIEEKILAVLIEGDYSQLQLCDRLAMQDTKLVHETLKKLQHELHIVDENEKVWRLNLKQFIEHIENSSKAGKRIGG